MSTDGLGVIAVCGLLLCAPGASGEEREIAAVETLGPCAVVASKDGKKLYVANFDAKQLAVVDLGCNRVVNDVSVIDLAGKKHLGNAVLDDGHLGAANPWGVASSADGRTVFVAHSGSHELSVIPFAPVLERLRSGEEFRGPIFTSGLTEVRQSSSQTRAT